MESKLSSSTVQVSISGQVAIVEMNRPEALNALNKEILTDLLTTLNELSEMDQISIVVLKGKGQAFSSGGDIKAMLTLDNQTELFDMMDCINELVEKLYTIPKLTISAISGAAAGLGLSLALASDYIIADGSAKIAMNFIGIGLIPDGGGHFFLEQRLGENRAKQLIWEGKVLSAEEALQIGLINQAITGDIEEAVQEKLTEWLNKPILAMLKTKQIFVKNNREQLLKVFAQEKAGQLDMRQTADHLEGIQAFVEKRQPNYKGI